MPIPRKIETSPSSSTSRSAGFWLILSVALGLYGLAVLSPKLADREQLLADAHAQQVQLVNDEQKLARLQHVAVSLQQDARLFEKLLQQKEKPRQNGEEIIPLEGNLIYREPGSETADSQLPEERTAPWYAPVLSAIGHSSDIRGVLLLSSVVLILFAFGFLPPAEAVSEVAADVALEEFPRKPSILSKWASRYSESVEDDEHEDLLARLALLDMENDWELDALPIDAVDEDDVDETDD